MSPRSNRRLAIVAAVAFFVSSVFPVVAGVSHNTASFPKWWGVVDVSLAFVLALLALAILGVTQHRVNKQAEDVSYRAYRILTHGIFLMLVVFFLAGDRIVWSNCILCPHGSQLSCRRREMPLHERFCNTQT